MADVFEDKLELSLKRLRDPQSLKRYANMVVPRGGEQKEQSLDDLVGSVQPRNQGAARAAFRRLRCL